ncbi:Arm DNA-binding domain-containing protein [Roseovarius amoyensis]|uniref:Arm DNA-binding domain-containing protein n=1 Tax=Roseovarius amoyensis TaxID=2211448 RepID=UPI0030841F3F
MERTLRRLTAAKLKGTAPGKYADGGGLWLHKRTNSAGLWFLRVTVHGRRREMGLGGWPGVSLKEARDNADHWRPYVRQGIDPIKERQRQHREAVKNLHCLNEIALDAFESRKAGLKGDGKAGRRMSP